MQENYPKGSAYHLPPLGQRIIKTAAAVYVCMVIYALRGYEVGEMPAESMITAIICMQADVHGSRASALSRLFGTLLGAVWGLLFLLIPLRFSGLATRPLLFYGLMALCTLGVLYSAVALGQAGSACQAAIVFLCVVIAFPDIGNPLHQAWLRMVDVFIGTAVAIGINAMRLPKERHREQVFFLRTQDMVPDRYAAIAPSVLFQLNALCDEGARICLISPHAPAFFTQQLSRVHLNMPMIIMDGAAVYDVADNRYLDVVYMPEREYIALAEALRQVGKSFSVYMITRGVTCISQQGEPTAQEAAYAKRMRRTPYRMYIDSQEVRPQDVVFVRLLLTKEEADGVLAALRARCAMSHLRIVRREQDEMADMEAVYIYSRAATLARARQEVLRRVAPGQSLIPREFFAANGYQSERDALRLLRGVAVKYAPVCWPRIGIKRPGKRVV